jgi:hypothetical protein
MIAWIYHYFPFFSMSRQLFLHHYLPAHLCSALVAGSVFHFIAADTINFPVSIAGATTRRRRRTAAEVSKKMIAAVVIIIVMECVGYYYLSPLTYGMPGLDPEEVNRRRILTSWTLVSPSAFSSPDEGMVLMNEMMAALRKIKEDTRGRRMYSEVLVVIPHSICKLPVSPSLSKCSRHWSS